MRLDTVVSNHLGHLSKLIDTINTIGPLAVQESLISLWKLPKDYLTPMPGHNQIDDTNSYYLL